MESNHFAVICAGLALEALRRPYVAARDVKWASPPFDAPRTRLGRIFSDSTLLSRRFPPLSSLRMGITQYNEVPAEYASLLVENYTNAL